MVNLKQTMDAFAGGDYDLREALTDATDLKQVGHRARGGGWQGRTWDFGKEGLGSWGWEWGTWGE